MGFQPYFPNIPNGTIEQPKEIAVTKMNFPDTVVACLGVYSINAALVTKLTDGIRVTLLLR